MVIYAVRAICPISSTDYNVASQADANAVNLCHTFHGTITVVTRNVTDITSIPGVKHITGDLHVGPSAFSPNQTSMSYFSMQSLVLVDGQMNVGPISNLATLDLPALLSVGQSF